MLTLAPFFSLTLGGQGDITVICKHNNADFGVVFQFNIGRQGDIDRSLQTYANFGAIFQFNIGRQGGIDLNLQTYADFGAVFQFNLGDREI